MRSIDPLFYDGVIDLQPKVQPVTGPGSKPQTGGPSAVINTASVPAEPANHDEAPAPFLQSRGDQFVINGTMQIPKKKAALIGGGAIGAALLLKYIL